MTIEELVRKRNELENTISRLVNDLVNDFVKETNVQVSCVDLQEHRTMDGTTTYTTAVRLNLSSIGL